MIHIILFRPEIPSNTGAIIRLSANTGSHLHLIHPLGFDLQDKKLRRAGLDYHEFAEISQHQSLSECLSSLKDIVAFAFTTKGSQLLHEVAFPQKCALVFGSETSGLGEELSYFNDSHRCRLPMMPDSRSINLANAVSVAVYEAWRQHGFIGGQ